MGRVMPEASARSLYRAIGMTLLLFGGVLAIAMLGFEGRSSNTSVPVYLGIGDQVALRAGLALVGVAVAGFGFWLWRRNGGKMQHERTE